ncbi:hypothetical protein ABK040_016189 [Willaertia magna]
MNTIPVHVEVCLHIQSNAKNQVIEQLVQQFLIQRQPIIQEGEIPILPSTIIEEQEQQKLIIHRELTEQEKYLSEHVKSITIADLEIHPMYNGTFPITSSNISFQIHVYRPTDEEPIDETTEMNGNVGGGGLFGDFGGGSSNNEEELTACKQWILPNINFEGLWESLIFDDCIKYNLLEYVSTTMLFSDLGINNNLISWNRVALLYGPPGTGKTSLCKGLAQKLAIRLSHRFANGGLLIEINAHSLFSKWFSESGKLVMKLFSKIYEIVEDEDAFVCVLIDEVESLTAARKSALNGSEPSDSIRVVNAVLTQLDQLKRYKNVLILTTSNVTEAIDLAFVDRADIKQYIGPPSVKAKFSILRSCLIELMRVKLVTPNVLIPKWNEKEALENEYALYLKDICEKAKEVSGRGLRKLPFLAFAYYIGKHIGSVSLKDYLFALDKAIDNRILQLTNNNE